MATKSTEILTVIDLLSDAQSTLEELGEGLRDHYDNLPEGLQQSEYAQAMSDTADSIEYITWPDENEIPEVLRGLAGEVLPVNKKRTRQNLLDYAAACVSEAQSVVEMYMEDLGEAAVPEEVELAFLRIGELVDEVQSLEIPSR
jgi:hypothetical protein